jgi:hypothetical protein
MDQKLFGNHFGKGFFLEKNTFLRKEIFKYIFIFFLEFLGIKPIFGFVKIGEFM